MRYPDDSKVIINVTKAPYFADNTGTRDSTEALRRAIDDCVKEYIIGIEKLQKKLLSLSAESNGNVYVGAEAGRVIDGEVYITMPEEAPHAKIIYFPAGTYLVSDTVSYTFDNLFTQQTPSYRCELCRNIHFLGESRESTTIRLADNAPGFSKGCEKPVICFNTAAVRGKETTNCAQMNTIENITVNCGKGNDGAIGIRFTSSNCGRIENVSIIADSGYSGIDLDYGSEGVTESVDVTGFDYGIRTGRTAPFVLNNIDLSKNKICPILSNDGTLCLNRGSFGKKEAIRFEKSNCGRYFLKNDTISYSGDLESNYVFSDLSSHLDFCSVPREAKSDSPDDFAIVDDYGAIGDGKTDSTAAIQRAMNSGKPHILFGSGTYLLEKSVKIPKTVKSVDFMYCSLIPGYSLLIGEMDCAFDICEDSDSVFYAENFVSSDEFEGFFRMFKHSSLRDAVFSDIMTSSALYFNTVSGSNVYFDNCFTHTGHYSQDACLHRDGYTPVFCRMIPIELHTQNVYARNLNIERADVELLNDGSRLIIDGYKVEGPGVLIKSLNGSNTQINLFNAAWWGNKIENNVMFECIDSSLLAVGGLVHSFPEDEKFNGAYHKLNNNQEERCSITECGIPLSGKNSLGRSIGSLIKKISSV